MRTIKLLLLLLACEFPGSSVSSTSKEQGAALNSGYILAIYGDRCMTYVMIRLAVWHSLYSFRDVQGLLVAPA